MSVVNELRMVVASERSLALAVYCSKESYNKIYKGEQQEWSCGL